MLHDIIIFTNLSYKVRLVASLRVRECNTCCLAGFKAFEIAGYTEEDLKTKFGALYNAFQFGAPPHAGMAPGVDRMIMLLRNEENIREIIPFPMNGNAQDLMCGAPGEVTEQQLREVHIKVRQ